VPAQTASQTITINIAPAPMITSSSPLPIAVSGVGYFDQLEVSGGMAPFSWSVTGAPPAGIALSAYSGALSGSSAAIGTAAFSVTVTDANGATSTKPFSLTVANPAGALTLLNGLP